MKNKFFFHLFIALIQLIFNFPSRPEFSFSNFVISEGSRFAVDAIRQVCSGTPVPYHSLYIYGGKNLGKTHLEISAGNHIASHSPDKKVLYVTCDEFIRKIEMNDSASHETLTKMLEVDYFLLDDVEQISGHRMAQEKLYLIYNTLTEKGKKIVFTGNLPPSSLAATENYLTSRLQWGMTAELKPIDDATTAKIINKLGRDVELSIPENIIEYMLLRIPRDFLSIKQSVAKINRESFVKKSKVTLSLAKKALELH